MDENTGTRKKPRAISARPAATPADGGVIASAPTTQAGTHSGQFAGQQSPENMKVIEGGGVKTGPNVKAYIERQLKSVYDDVLNQPIPDRFLDLLNGLGDKKEGRE